MSVCRRVFILARSFSLWRRCAVYTLWQRQKTHAPGLCPFSVQFSSFHYLWALQPLGAVMLVARNITLKIVHFCDSLQVDGRAEHEAVGRKQHFRERNLVALFLARHSGVLSATIGIFAALMVPSDAAAFPNCVRSNEDDSSWKMSQRSVS